MREVFRPLAGRWRAAVVSAAMAAGLWLGPPADAQTPPPDEGIPVTTATAARRDVPILLRNIGAVQAFQSVVVRSRVDGTLEQVFFTEGQDVKRGDRLALIDPRPYAAALAQAKAKKTFDQVQLENARRDLARYSVAGPQRLRLAPATRYPGRDGRENAATLAGDAANIAAAQLNLDFCTIASPIDGRVGLRQVDVGNLVHANDISPGGIVGIAQIHPIAVLFSVPQDALPRIREAMGRGALAVQAFTPDDRTLLGSGAGRPPTTPSTRPPARSS